MLLGEYLGWCHDARLIAVAERDEHGHKCHEGLSAAHVALQQAVHLTARAHVVAYLVHDALLRTGQLEPEVLGVEAVEVVAHLREDVAAVLAAMVGGVTQYVELHVEELLELQSLARLLHLDGVLRIVDAAQGSVARDEVACVHDEVGQRLGYRLRYLLQHRLHHLLQGARGDVALLHLLGSDVVGLHAHLGELQFGGALYLGMRELEASAVYRGASKHDVVFAHLVGLVNVLRAGEPHEVDHSPAVGEVSHDALLACRHLELLKREYPAAYLHERHVALQFVYGIDAAPIHIFIWIVLQQVAPGAHAQLLVEHVLLIGADSRQIHYVL